ncbi:thioredoxin domain-containing protein [Sulfurimonas sp.]|nr:thioredoxin domain-containing protein [Sulfurimonas sp.]
MRIVNISLVAILLMFSACTESTENTIPTKTLKPKKVEVEDTASNSVQYVKDFLNKNFSNNPNIKSIDVKVTNTIAVKGHSPWSAYFIKLDAILKKDDRKVSQKMLWFSDGKIVTKELYDVKTGKDLKDSVSLPFKDEYYKKSNLIYGHANSKHKVVIFSDPLCPFCRSFVPAAIEYMKKEPNKFAVYYYHFPLPGLHPAAVELVKAAVVLENKGVKDVVLKLYKVEVDAKEKSIDKILKAFNSVMKSNLKPSDINIQSVISHLNQDMDIANEVMVQGTPTMFFDGKLDKTKNKYKEVK